MKVKLLKNTYNYQDVHTGKPVHGIVVEMNTDGYVRNEEFTKQGFSLDVDGVSPDYLWNIAEEEWEKQNDG